MKRILVIGASSMDVVAQSSDAIKYGDSNPGKVALTPGGVARNIAVNLHRLGQEVTFISVFGNDPFSHVIKNELQLIGLKTIEVVHSTQRTPLFVSILHPTGELETAVSDFVAMEECTPNTLQNALHNQEVFDVAVFDANVPLDTISYFIKAYPETLLYIDGVSQAKVTKLASILSHISLCKINKSELSSLLNKKSDDVILAVKELISRGLKQVIVTNGAEPITYNIGRSIYQTVVFEPEIQVSTLGCGDALFAGTIYGLIQGKSMHEALNLGKQAAAITMEVSDATNPHLSKESIENDI
jgi:pseudouridine kinase